MQDPGQMSSWFADDHLPTMCSCGLSWACGCRERAVLFLPVFMTSFIHPEGVTLTTSSEPHYLPKALPQYTIPWGGQDLNIYISERHKDAVCTISLGYLDPGSWHIVAPPCRAGRIGSLPIRSGPAESMPILLP